MLGKLLKTTRLSFDIDREIKDGLQYLAFIHGTSVKDLVTQSIKGKWDFEAMKPEVEKFTQERMAKKKRK